MHWFLDPIKNQYADFSGRTTRQAFWMYILIYVLLYIAVGMVAAVLGLEVLTLVFALAVIVPGFAITARRLHDVGMSGWWQLIGLVPFVGLIVMIVLTVRDSEAGSNQYGSNPNETAANSAPETGQGNPEQTNGGMS